MSELSFTSEEEDIEFSTEWHDASHLVDEQWSEGMKKTRAKMKGRRQREGEEKTEKIWRRMHGGKL